MRRKKPVAQRKVPRKKIARTRNSGTMTESQFWSMIRSALRQKSRFWKPIAQCKQNARRKYNGTNKRQKFEYQCNICKEYFPDKHINVDHIQPAGALNCSQDLPGFVERLFCGIENLQVLCESCHNDKTKEEKKTKRDGKVQQD
jgi:5-methylcytosine-specific restriction endonuclease McrA